MISCAFSVFKTAKTLVITVMISINLLVRTVLLIKTIKVKYQIFETLSIPYFSSNFTKKKKKKKQKSG